MTLIECYTDSHIDNIAACLRLKPENVVFIGDPEEMEQPLDRYRRLLQQRQIPTLVTALDIRGMDFADICHLLRDQIREEEECVIDLTGGDEAVIMAVGALLVGLEPQQRRNIRVEKYDPRSDAIYDCIHDNRKVCDNNVTLTVEEIIALHGGGIHPNSYQPPENCSRTDLQPLWDIVSDDPWTWNQSISALNEFEGYADSREQVFLLPYHLGGIKNFTQKEDLVRTLLEKLLQRGIIDGRISARALEYSFASPLLRFCTLKAGNVLEVKTLLEGRDLRKDGSSFFQDCRMGVSIDWDGVPHQPEDQISDTRNEIDVILVHGTTPLFISCKNGNINEEELYKLHTVATRFGGPYAKKMLIATELNRKSPAGSRSFIQRAIDMNICLVTDAAQLDRDGWQQALMNALQ